MRTLLSRFAGAGIHPAVHAIPVTKNKAMTRRDRRVWMPPPSHGMTAKRGDDHFFNLLFSVTYHHFLQCTTSHALQK
jgi:hypothetical protein